MVRWHAADRRGLPLLLRRRSAQRGPFPGRPADLDGDGWSSAQVRNRRRTDGPLFLADAKSGLPAGTRRAAAADRGDAFGLSQAVPQKISGRGQAEDLTERTAGQEVEPAPHAHGTVLPAGEPGPAHPRPLAQHDAVACRTVRLRAQSLLPPGGRKRPAAALHRPVRSQRELVRAYPGKDRHGRERPAGKWDRFRRLYLS